MIRKNMPKLILQRLKTELKTGASKRSLSKAGGGFRKKFWKIFETQYLDQIGKVKVLPIGLFP